MSNNNYTSPENISSIEAPSFFSQHSDSSTIWNMQNQDEQDNTPQFNLEDDFSDIDLDPNFDEFDTDFDEYDDYISEDDEF